MKLESYFVMGDGAAFAQLSNRLPVIVGIVLVLSALISVPQGMAATAETVAQAWAGEWAWDASDQHDVEYSGRLSIRHCDERGCNYDLTIGSESAVCQANGMLTFKGAQKATSPVGEDGAEKVAGGCALEFERNRADHLRTDANGDGCSQWCGPGATFGGIFYRRSKQNYFATSFDCYRAKSAVEHAICSSETLSALDVQLANRYKALRESLPVAEKNRLRSEQQRWLTERDTRCAADPGRDSCLHTAYQGRLLQLNATTTGANNK